MLAIGSAAGAASFTHVHNVAAAHGQPGWLAWADAVVLELMSIASGLELRRRKRNGSSTRFPATVLGCAVVLSLAAQVVEAEPSPIGWIAAAVPALGFLVMVKVALGYAGSAPTVDRSTRARTVRVATVDRPATSVQRMLVEARRVQTQLAAAKVPLTRGALAEALRAEGHTVSNARASELLKLLKAEST
ncbi:DUF2637 domain-containing protein [Dactylosporangium sp. CA-052675]|uniref:DUF2637 domain-containing protein n=1 Tax=Dactylosporangium sp. CA-052675 TaxID=3239927 RepID=UPI003D8DC6C4